MFAQIQKIAPHPLRINPYNQIRFARFNQHGAALYVVGSDKRERGSVETLKSAFQLFGGQCFHCKMALKSGKLSEVGSIDHVRPKSAKGTDDLHNLVIACQHCNRLKANRPLARFNGDLGDEYLVALNELVTSMVGALREAATSDPAY